MQKAPMNSTAGHATSKKRATVPDAKATAGVAMMRLTLTEVRGLGVTVRPRLWQVKSRQILDGRAAAGNEFHE